MHLTRPTAAIIDLDALSFNLRSARDFLGTGTEIMAVVKANAYGHGAVECSRRLKAEGVERLAVAIVEEAAELRDAGVAGDILILGGIWPEQAELTLKYGLTPAIFRLESAEALNSLSIGRETRTKIHIKIDTGMGRVGVPLADAAEFARAIARLENLEVEGLMTHFSSADDLGQSDFTNFQMDRFGSVVETFANEGIRPPILDLANSPASVAFPRSRSGLVRLGGILYGLGGDVLPDVPQPALMPVMSVTSEVGFVKKVAAGDSLGYGRTFTAERDSIIATVPVGYADGYPRMLSNKGTMIVAGQVAPVVGRVSMDWTILDVTNIPNVEVGTKVTVIGADGEDRILAEDLAAACDTISYEITCGFSARVPRLFKSS
ncbi:MAG: alanine racemase [Acidobacteria bacterium OLB17]|nr:MAG: alanine racemase [Acidobacteria bacterium OLB17]MCZ2389557.1 alanine racemase [Acidobacteriota bacterium]